MTALNATSLRRALGAGAERSSSEAAGRFASAAEDAGLVEVAYATADTPLGQALVAATERGLVMVGLPNYPADEALARLAERISPRVLESRRRLDPVLRELNEYFEGRRERFDVGLDWQLVRSAFCRRILDETARVPFGATATYGEVAARVGSPRAHRAAGSALGSNPIPIVVPCHRIVRSGGLIGNYGGGPQMKEYLLRLEGALSGD